MSRIRSQHGNVIAADFRPRVDIEFTVNTETLYCDGAVMLLRTTVSLDDKLLVSMHHLGDLATGHIVQLNNG